MNKAKKILKTILTENWQIAFLLLVFSIIAFASIFGIRIGGTTIQPRAITFDEVAHIGAGFHYWEKGEIFLNPEHPPLPKLVAGFPLWLAGVDAPKELNESEADEWDLAEGIPRANVLANDQYTYGNALLFHSNFSDLEIVQMARVSIVLFTLILLFTLYFVLRKIFSKKVALISVAFIILQPTFIGHSILANTDTISALMIVINVFVGGLLFKKFTRSERIEKRLLVSFAISFAFALLSKYSAYILLGVYGVIYGVFIIQLLRKKFYKLIWKVVYSHILIGLIALALIWTVYWFFSRNMSYSDIENAIFTYNYYEQLPFSQNISDLIDTLLSSSTLFYPFYLISQGIAMVLTRMDTAYQSITFLGDYYADESAGILYFPVLYFAKSTIWHVLFSISVLTGLALSVYARTTSRIRDRFTFDSILVPTAVFFGIFLISSLFSDLQIGFRHIMPLLVLVSIIFALVYERFERAFTHIRTYLAGILLLSLVSVILSFPGYINYYNFVARGMYEGGILLSNDSNLDWNQNMYDLKAWIEEKQLTFVLGYISAPIDFSESLGVPYEFYDMKVLEPLASGTIIIASSTNWANLVSSGNHERLVDYYRSIQIDSISNTYLIFQIQ
jgi:hypothetical protein